MGMAASQARFLGLTARKSNNEYEGQQINQSRTALATESAENFNLMYELHLPTAPIITFVDKTTGKLTVGDYIGMTFDEAMAQYNIDQAEYDANIAKINAKTEVIHQHDSLLELKLKQLDTDHQAIQTEMDAVKKVIDKNIDATFKTFA